MAAQQISKKRKVGTKEFVFFISVCNTHCCQLQFVADGVFKAELNEYLMRELAEDG